MSEEKEQAAPTEQNGKSGMMNYIILGAVGLVLAVAAAGGTYFFLAGKQTAEISDSTHQSDTIKKDASHASKDTGHTSHAAGSEAENVDSTTLSHDDLTIPNDPTDIDVNSPEFMAEVQRNMDALNMPAEDHLEALDTTTGAHNDTAPDSLALSWLDEREKKLIEREKTVSVREAELSSLQKKIDKQMAVIEQSESTKIMNLAKMYDGMDPNAVAKLAENLDDQTVVLLLPRMKQKNASQVLAAMPPVRAAKLSQQLISVGE